MQQNHTVRKRIENTDPRGLAKPIGNMLSGKAALKKKAAGIRTRNIASVL
jgi:hypothetical protein